jgi:hypothetical protein
MTDTQTYERAHGENRFRVERLLPRPTGAPDAR